MMFRLKITKGFVTLKKKMFDSHSLSLFLTLPSAIRSIPTIVKEVFFLSFSTNIEFISVIRYSWEFSVNVSYFVIKRA